MPLTVRLGRSRHLSRDLRRWGSSPSPLGPAGRCWSVLDGERLLSQPGVAAGGGRYAIGDSDQLCAVHRGGADRLTLNGFPSASKETARRESHGAHAGRAAGADLRLTSRSAWLLGLVAVAAMTLTWGWHVASECRADAVRLFHELHVDRDSAVYFGGRDYEHLRHLAPAAGVCVGALSGSIRGGLAMVTIGSSMLLAEISGLGGSGRRRTGIDL